MSEKLTIDALRMEIAKRHNILLDEHDPIFALLTLNELVLEHYIVRAETAGADAERRFAAQTEQHLAAVPRVTIGPSASKIDL
jgi:hypothetical protein